MIYYICNDIALDSMLYEYGGVFMSSTIQVRVDDDLKIKSDNLFKELGTDTTTAIRMFLTQQLLIMDFHLR